MPRYRLSSGCRSISRRCRDDRPAAGAGDRHARRTQAGQHQHFQPPLQHAIADVLERREQAILFLNRRGQSTYVFCRDCGYIATCPRCDTPLTYHRQGSALRCHRCGFQQPEPQICPECGSKRIKYFGAGTQQVEQALVEQFPRARVVRWDSDTAVVRRGARGDLAALRRAPRRHHGRHADGRQRA